MDPARPAPDSPDFEEVVHCCGGPHLQDQRIGQAVEPDLASGVNCEVDPDGVQPRGIVMPQVPRNGVEFGSWLVHRRWLSHRRLRSDTRLLRNGEDAAGQANGPDIIVAD